MLNLRRILLGRRLASDETEKSRIGNVVGLAVFSSDALSSVAYATQEIMASLSASGMAIGVVGAAWLFGMSVPVACGIVALLLILGTSYRQTIRAYPGGGGAYIVAKENLGELAAQTAGAALLTDYILTVAASVSSGVAAITSALPWLQGHNVLLTILAIVFVAAANLRGVRESGSFFAIPTYGFVACIILLLVAGFWQWAFGGPPPAPSLEQAGREIQKTQLVSGAALVWIFMRAYSAGCTALTGVEAISNGVMAFREPAAHNASKTMIWMILLLGGMFMGITLLSHHFGVTYHHSADPSIVGETLLSKLAKAIYGDVSSGLPRLVYLVTQGCTFAILVVAANTAYADFPRLAALQARDGFLPKQFAIQGDRLVFSNGIIILTLVSGLLVWILNANTDLLLPLYALGVFIGFTLSQAGMVVHWFRLRNKARHWHTKAAINGLGALTSGIVMLDIGITKFTHGAWFVVLLIPFLVHVFFRIHRHYIGIKAKLAVSRLEAFLPPKHHALVLISGIHGGVVEALAYARLISGDRVEALTVDLGSDGFTDSPALARLRSDWNHYGMGVPLRAVPSPYRRIVEPVLEEVERFRQAEPDVCLTVILPEFVTFTWWERLLHGQMAFRIKTGLMMKPGVIVTSVRIHLPR
ncbi:APC family permease [Holophaga foetida]|uniref:APC family permease n=1 Tax=Holophaga foetida TaxID=35839 RepID=UPI0002474D44|nr:APC family permease [Holophaga foetida]